MWKQRLFSQSFQALFFGVGWIPLFIVSLLITLAIGTSVQALHPTTWARSVSNVTIPSKLDLSAEWKFASGNLQSANAYSPDLADRNWASISVPGNWYLQGKDHSGVAWYRHHFQVDRQLQDKVVQLVFDGVDYTADVWINGQYLGFHEGYFQPFQFDISKYLKYDSDNVIAVKVNSPFEETPRIWSLHKRIIKGVLSHHDTRPGGAWDARGQDQNTGGIWAGVRLQISDQITIVSQQVTPQLAANLNAAIAKVDLTILNPGSHPLSTQIALQLHPHNFSGTAELPIRQEQRLNPGLNHITVNLSIRNPHLWWTWEKGRPDLYDVRTQILMASKILDAKNSAFGFRSIRYSPHSQVWELNGQRTFLRGTNYIASQWLSEMTPAKYKQDLQLMQAANINAVRVHAHIEEQEFYRLCDELGVLVWQDFPLQWGYSDSSEFVTEATHQAKDMVTMLYNHPSVFAWCIHNEPPWDATWMKSKYPDYNPKQNQVLDETIYNSLLPLDRTRHLAMVSSTNEHPWWGWYSGQWQDYGKPTKNPLITEFGAQALPNLDSLQQIFTATELFPDTPEKLAKWKYHNFQPHETFNIAKVPMGKNIQEFISNTQQYQAQLVQFAAESYRRQRYQPVSAIFQFMFVEDWPSVNWGIVDYWRKPKPGFEALKLAYQPVLPSIAGTQQQSWKQGQTVPLELWLVNDLQRSFLNSQLSYVLQKNAKAVQQESMFLHISPDSGNLVRKLNFSGLSPGTYQLLVDIKDRRGQNLGKNHFQFTVRPS
jgi:beta-mannosidase